MENKGSSLEVVQISFFLIAMHQNWVLPIEFRRKPKMYFQLYIFYLYLADCIIQPGILFRVLCPQLTN